MKQFLRWLFHPYKRIRELRVDLAASRRYNIGLAMENHRLHAAMDGLQYWRDISECDCPNPLPQGGCLRCDLNKILLLGAERMSEAQRSSPSAPGGDTNQP